MGVGNEKATMVRTAGLRKQLFKSADVDLLREMVRAMIKTLMVGYQG